MARQVEEEKQKGNGSNVKVGFGGDGDSVEEGNFNEYERIETFDKSHTSFKSMISDATMLTKHEQEINRLVHQDISEQEDLDEYLEKLLAIQRQKGAIMQKKFQESEEWKALFNNGK